MIGDKGLVKGQWSYLTNLTLSKNSIMTSLHLPRQTGFRITVSFRIVSGDNS